MIAPFATLLFLAALWLVAKSLVETIEDGGGRIVAALLGRPYRRETYIPAMRVRVSRPPIARPVRAVQWRAAA